MEKPFPNTCSCCTSSETPLSVLSSSNSRNLFEFLIWFVGFQSDFECSLCGLCENKLRACMQFRELIFQSHSKICGDIKEEKLESNLNETAKEEHTNAKRKKKKEKTEVITICQICQKQFSSANQLKRHLDIHKQPKFQCDDCGKRFLDQQRLKVHKVAHTNVRNIKCPLCPGNKGYFKDKRYLRQHYLLCHSADRRNFSCADCGHTTKTLQSLKTHLATHYVQLRKFVCEICDSRYVFPRDLARHIQRRHRKERPFKCDQCSKTYMAAHVLAAHKKIVHSGFRFECKFCDKAYNGSSALLEHLFSHRGDKPYTCPVCQSGYISWTNFRNHLKRMHNVAYDAKIHGYKGSLPDILRAGMKKKEPETSINATDT